LAKFLKPRVTPQHGDWRRSWLKVVTILIRQRQTGRCGWQVRHRARAAGNARAASNCMTAGRRIVMAVPVLQRWTGAGQTG
jgi:hypothetical protein